MATKAKLKIVRIQKHEQTFGGGSTPYATFLCETDMQEFIPVGLSHPMLKSSGISSALFEDLVGSTIIVNDDVDLSTGAIRREALDRIQGVVEKRPKQSILLVNGSNAEIIKSETLRESSFDYQSRVDSAVKVAEERERRLQRARLRAQQMEAELKATVVAEKSDSAEIVETTQEVSDIVAELEKNDEELPF